MYDKAGIRFAPEKYVEVNVGEEITLKTIIDGVEKDYDVTGGGDITVEPLTVTENGTYDAGANKAYNPVTVNVSEGVEVESLSVTDNGTYTAPEGKAYTPVTVNVMQYKEELLWTNPNPGTGFNIDMRLIDINSLSPAYPLYRIEWRRINNASIYASMVVPVEDLIAQGISISSCDENNNIYTRAIQVDSVEISQDPPAYREMLIARGLCSQIGVNNEKKFRCIPYKIYGVTGIEF